ncbi:LOW QUALITY PROTEIN: quaternary ammonium compound-resistance protein SugE [Geomicrobium sp. JCM 19037]|nr:LOW QUALITY PROTEIN: quaternary ammonium compound-resistance protein SugE [Geomicrobium sp. JCM 19037]
MWVVVVIAAIFEIGWATGLKYANDALTWTLTIIAIVISFGLLIRAASTLLTSTVYAVFVGLGTVGTVAVDIIFFGTAINIGVIFFVVMLLSGVLGLKMVTGEKEEGRSVGSFSLLRGYLKSLVSMEFNVI